MIKAMPSGSDEPRPDRAIGIWLLVCAGLVFALAVLGGATRLTGSGLSMVEWRPVTGVLPPLDAAEWDRVFAAYRDSPEFTINNTHLDLAGFQRIFWLEYLHRLLARLVGVVFALPFVILLARRRLSRGDAERLVALFLLGGSQGVLGWFMVRSGLADVPHVSPYRLAAHLLLGAALIAALLWEALRRLDVGAPIDRSRRQMALSITFGLCAALALLSGAFMAGTGSGHMYRTFPLIDGQLIPSGIARLDPWWRNPVENPLAVHLFHRSAALSLAVLAVVIGWTSWRSKRRPARAGLLVGAVLAQASLGVTVLLAGVPPGLAGLHQACGLAVLACWVIWHYRLVVDRAMAA